MAERPTTVRFVLRRAHQRSSNVCCTRNLASAKEKDNLPRMEQMLWHTFIRRESNNHRCLTKAKRQSRRWCLNWRPVFGRSMQARCSWIFKRLGKFVMNFRLTNVFATKNFFNIGLRMRKQLQIMNVLGASIELVLTCRRSCLSIKSKYYEQVFNVNISMLFC